MKKIYYEKRGRRYVPVSEYDSEYLDSFSRGTHIVMCYPGGQSRRYNIDPNYAAMIAAGRVAEDAMSEAVRKASELRPQQATITPGQKKAWERLAKEFGTELATLQINSARDIAEAGVKAMQQEAQNLMNHPAVKDAYDKFLFTCELVKNASSK